MTRSEVTSAIALSDSHGPPKVACILRPLSVTTLLLHCSKHSTILCTVNFKELELSKRVVVVVLVHQSILTFLAFHCNHIKLN